MRMLTRSIPALGLIVCLGAADVAAQQSGGNGAFQWYVGGQGGVLFFKTPTQGRQGIPSFGGQTLIVAKRTGLLLSVEEAVGDNETSGYNDTFGAQPVTFNDLRKYSGVLMAFPLKTPVAPYLGVGFGILHVVNPQPTSTTASQSVARELGSTGFGTFLAGVQFKLSRFMAFGQYQITTSPSQKFVTDTSGTVTATGQLLVGPTHTFSGGLRIGLGNAREDVRGGGY